MQQLIRTLTKGNISAIATDFHESLDAIGGSIQGKTGVALFTALKR